MANVTTPTVVWLVRHAESATPMVFHGAESDVELGPIGHAQAAAAGPWFAQFSPTRIVSSAMRRAIQTAEGLNQTLRVPHTIDARFHERIVGVLGGTSFEISGGLWSDTITAWNAGDRKFTTDGAESYDQLAQRLLPAWHDLVQTYCGERIVLVSHGISIKVMLLELLANHGPTSWKAIGHVPNVSVSELCESESGEWDSRLLFEVPEPVAELRRTIQPPATGTVSQG